MSERCDFVTRQDAPPCRVCGGESDWQIGTYIPFKAKPVFFCNTHLPARWQAEFERQEREREQMRRRYEEASKL